MMAGALALALLLVEAVVRFGIAGNTPQDPASDTQTDLITGPS
jgi:hypothetical protein